VRSRQRRLHQRDDPARFGLDDTDRGTSDALRDTKRDSTALERDSCDARGVAGVDGSNGTRSNGAGSGQRLTRRARCSRGDSRTARLLDAIWRSETHREGHQTLNAHLRWHSSVHATDDIKMLRRADDDVCVVAAGFAV